MSSDELRITSHHRRRAGEYWFTFNDDKTVRCIMAFGGHASFHTELGASIKDDNPRYATHLELITQWIDEQFNP